MIYLFSDGFQDQFGGKKDKKIGISRMKQLFLAMHDRKMSQQHMILQQYFAAWIAQSKTKQIDDVLVLGMRI